MKPGHPKEAPVASILVVENEADIRDLLVDTLADLGHQVLQAPEGQAGLELALQELPDFILLDVMMPVMDGVQVLEQLKSNGSTRSIPVVMVSAKGQEQDLMAATAAGAWGHIVKPWDLEDLEARVCQALEAAGKRV